MSFATGIKEGMPTLRMDGMKKVAAVTTLEEVIKETAAT